MITSSYGRGIRRRDAEGRMGHSGELRTGDVTAVMRLAREVCELGEDATAWRVHVLTELGRMVGAKFRVAAVLPYPFDPARAGMTRVVEVGLTADEAAVWHEYQAKQDLRADPTTPGLAARLGATYTVRRAEVCDDRTWYASAHFNEVRRAIHCDDQLNANVALPGQGLAVGMGFVRGLGDRPFSARDAKVVSLFNMELEYLWRTPVLGGNGGDAAEDGGLSRRQGEVRELLLGGGSEKEIATRLGLSRHTVHNYVRALYRRAGVSSRAEYCAGARAAAGGRRYRPRVV